MSAATKELVRQNIAKRMGVASYEELIKAGVHEEKRIVAQASKKMKNNKIKVKQYLSSGNPYVMLGLKVNAKGKRVK